MQQARPPRDLASYVVTVKGKPCSITVDLAVVERAPVTTHPVRCLVSTELEAPDPDGLPTAVEEAALAAVDEGVATLFEDVCDGIYVGGYTREGRHVLVAYTPPERWRDLRLGAEWKPYRLHMAALDEPDWEYFETVLVPDARERWTIEADRELERLLALGRRPGDMLTVEHFAAFSDEADLRRAAAEARAAGFALRAQAGHDEGELTLVRAVPLDREPFREALGRAMDLVERCHGRYDGWGIRL